ncbi:hypothetical protein XENOCAPTIV_004218 [Xenoophorus captivus]|uniref:Uncharacterized protein n=1 Tax=Xenoophorus captivus TaxID=1517983 RepID=A0ABV0RQ39_9TELE
MVVLLGLLDIRRFQTLFTRLYIDLVHLCICIINLFVLQWGIPHILSEGVPLNRLVSHISVFIEASLSGWGGTCLSQVVRGQWPGRISLHINSNSIQFKDTLLIPEGKLEFQYNPSKHTS